MVKHRSPQRPRSSRKPTSTAVTPAAMPALEAVEAPSLPPEAVPEPSAPSVHDQLLESVSHGADHDTAAEELTVDASVEIAAEAEPAPAVEAVADEPAFEPTPTETTVEPVGIDAAPELAAEATEVTEESAAAVQAAITIAPVAVPDLVAPSVVPLPAPSFPRGRAGFAAAQLDVGGIGATLASYMRGESAAAFSHLKALSSARSPADMIRLQVTEMQRAADASLTCWSDIARKASRIVELR